MKQTNQSSNGTSFHGDTFTASVEDLEKICGVPAIAQNNGRDKVNFVWDMETESGKVFTIYDWKEYRIIDDYECIEWHIGGHSPSDTYEALNEIASALNELE